MVLHYKNLLEKMERFKKSVFLGRTLCVILILLLESIQVSCVKVVVDIEEPRRQIQSKDHFVCVNFDWWPNSKYSKNPGAHYPWVNSSVLNVDFDNPTLISSLQALSPVYLRVGGSLADQITYDFKMDEEEKQIKSENNINHHHQDEVVQKSHFSFEGFTSRDSLCIEPVANESMTLGYNAGCINGDRYSALHEFCIKSKCKIIFGLNGLYGMKSEPNTTELWSGVWNSSQAELLLNYTKMKGFSSTLAGVELGNEIDGAAGKKIIYIYTHPPFLRDSVSFIYVLISF